MATNTNFYVQPADVGWKQEWPEMWSYRLISALINSAVLLKRQGRKEGGSWINALYELWSWQTNSIKAFPVLSVSVGEEGNISGRWSHLKRDPLVFLRVCGRFLLIYLKARRQPGCGDREVTRSLINCHFWLASVIASSILLWPLTEHLSKSHSSVFAPDQKKHFCTTAATTVWKETFYSSHLQKKIKRCFVKLTWWASWVLNVSIKWLVLCFYWEEVVKSKETVQTGHYKHLKKVWKEVRALGTFKHSSCCSFTRWGLLPPEGVFQQHGCTSDRCVTAHRRR